MYGVISAPYWDDRPVAIVAGGPSLVGFDFERLRDFHVIAVKGSIFDIPWADAGFGIDMPRFEEWREKLAALSMPIYWAVPDEKIAVTAPSDNMIFLKRLPGEGVSNKPGAVYGGGTSGFAALQVAILKKAKRIGLFGYDYDGATPTAMKNHVRNGEHFRHNDQHYGKRRAQNASSWSEWAANFKAFASCGVDIINACPQSKITAFVKMSIDDTINDLHRSRP